MTIQKSIIYTILYLIILEFVSFWIFLVPEELLLQITPFLHFINSLIQLILVLFFVNKNQKITTYLKNTSLKYYLIAIILGIGFTYFQSILNSIYYMKLPKNSLLINYDFSKLKSVGVFTSIIIVPITEELFFRNYLQNKLQKTLKANYSILLVSFLFALIHLPFVALFFNYLEFSFHQAYIAFFGGIISGILFYKSKSIIPSIIFHVVWNLIANIAFY